MIKGRVLAGQEDQHHLLAAVDDIGKLAGMVCYELTSGPFRQQYYGTSLSFPRPRPGDGELVVPAGDPAAG